MTEISQKTLKLIRDLKANNERDWYKERKPEFEEHVIEPFARFLEDVSARLDAVGYSFFGGKDTMFRMQRDTRFSKGKTPYKTSVSGMLTPSGTKEEARGCGYRGATGARSKARICELLQG